MTLSIAATVTEAMPLTTAAEAEDMPIIDKIRRGRLAALAALRARTAQSGNVVSIFDTAIETREVEPVFRSQRAGQHHRSSRVLLTKAIPA